MFVCSKQKIKRILRKGSITIKIRLNNCTTTLLYLFRGPPFNLALYMSQVQVIKFPS